MHDTCEELEHCERHAPTPMVLPWHTYPLTQVISLLAFMEIFAFFTVLLPMCISLTSTV